MQFYLKRRDWAGLGYQHRMIGWIDRHGYPRSITFSVWPLRVITPWFMI